MAWLVFSYTLPAQSRSSPRVVVWRRLRQIGAVAVAGWRRLNLTDAELETRGLALFDGLDAALAGSGPAAPLPAKKP